VREGPNRTLVQFVFGSTANCELVATFWFSAVDWSLLVLIWPIRMSVLRIKIPANAIKPRIGLKPNGTWKIKSVGDVTGLN
jgi:hypothetical protein